MTSEKKGFLETFMDIDRRIISVICLLCVALPLIKPFGLPIGIDDYSRSFYNEVEALPPGSNILLEIEIAPGSWGSFGSQGIDVLQHLFDKEGVRFIQVCFYKADHLLVFEQMILPKINQRDKEYGVDWVNLGFIEGLGTAMTKVSDDFLYGVKDYYGNLLEDLPLLNEVKSANDIDIYIYIGTGITSELSISYISVPYEIRHITSATGMDVASFITYMQAGLVQGILVESVGAAQYESLRGKPGMALGMMDSINALHMFMLGLIIAVNIVYVFQRMKGEVK